MKIVYTVIFEGKLLEGFSLEDVKEALTRKMKIKNAAVEALFSYNSVTVKKNLTLTEAERYKKSFFEIGMLVTLKESANFSVVEGESPKALSKVGELLVEQTTVKKAEFSTEALTLAPEGEIILEEAYPTASKFDTEQFSIQEAGNYLIEPKEFETREFNLAHIKLKTDNKDL